MGNVLEVIAIVLMIMVICVYVYKFVEHQKFRNKVSDMIKKNRGDKDVNK